VSARRRRRVAAVLMVLAAGVAGCASEPSPPALPAPVPSPDRPRLTWAPPPLSDPETIRLDRGQTVTRMDPTRDYVLQIPPEGKGDTFLVGGHNIVIIGGHISTGADPPPWDVPEHRAIYITDTTGVVHIEGMLIDDADVGRGDGIAIAAPLATVQIQNVRVVGLTGEERGNHADVVQVWGGVRELRIDRLTGATDYQGLHIQPDLAPNGPEIIKNANMYSTSDRSGNWLTWLSHGSNSCTTAQSISLDEVYATPRKGRDLGESVWPPDASAEVDAGRSGAVNGCLSTLSPDGAELSFPRLPQVRGVVRRGPPPGADFVPDGVAGPRYISPGYLDR
jgi:hypothetical protein